VADVLDWEDCERDDDWSIAWIDGRMIDPNWYRELRPTQRVNHFPGTSPALILFPFETILIPSLFKTMI
jgi:hypothetical protein